MQSLVLRTLSEIIREEITDPRVGNLGLSEADLSPDLSHARIKVAVIGDAQQADDCLAALNGAAQFLWHRLRDETDLRIVPRLVFEKDLSGVYLSEIDELLRQVPPAAAAGNDGETETSE